MSVATQRSGAAAHGRTLLGALALTLSLAAPALAENQLDGDVRLELSSTTTLVVPMDRELAYGKWTCVNARNPFSGEFLRDGAVPREAIMQEMEDEGVSRIRIVAGPCQTRFYGSSDAKEVMHVYSTITGEWVQSRALNKFTRQLVETSPVQPGEIRVK